MMWDVIKNFAPNVDEHIKLIKALSQEKTVYFVRKEYLEFEELDEEQKYEIIEDNYELFKEGILGVDENIKKEIEIRVIEELKQIPDLQINKTQDLSYALELIEKKESADKVINNIKKIIMDEILEEKQGSSLLNMGNYAFKTEHNESHKYYSSSGELENESKYFEWYKIEKIQELERFIEENNFNYNIMVTQDNNSDIQYEYYINYYEGEEFILAVRDNIGNFGNIFVNVFDY